MVVGIDEVGRGAWAGPMVVAAVALGGEEIPGLTDSKKLTAKRREMLSLQIKQTAAGIGIGWVSSKTIDRIGLSAALKLAARKALAGVTCEYDQIIIDGTIKLVDDPRVTTMKQADLLVPSVSAASIVAKVARDHYMAVIADTFPGYGFEGHVGYGTAAHSAALAEYGVTPIHRVSFAPIAGMKMKAVVPVSAPSTGQLAETAAADHLSSLGFRILERNWKTKWCEIDIIAERDNRIHFVEVKYRKNYRQGTGIDYVTRAKHKQMKFAAELWLSSRDNFDSAALSAIGLSGQPIVVDEFIEQI
jgi:ribonuclease HII